LEGNDGGDRVRNAIEPIEACRKCQNKEKIIFFVILQYQFAEAGLKLPFYWSAGHRD
jgi:hypothetical protein